VWHPINLILFLYAEDTRGRVISPCRDHAAVGTENDRIDGPAIVFQRAELGTACDCKAQPYAAIAQARGGLYQTEKPRTRRGPVFG
jgi:hypothetical protein